MIGLTNFWQIWTHEPYSICSRYVADLFGGDLASIPCGISNAIMTNVGAVLITKFVPLIRFHSKHKQKHAMVFSIFIISYLSMGLLIMRRFNTSGHKYLPPDFTPEWLIFYGKMIKT